MFYFPVVSKNGLEAQIASLSSSRHTSSTELDQLRRRIDECEREKRDLIGVVNRLKEDATQRDGVFCFFLLLYPNE